MATWPTVWEITPEHPDGFARPMTDGEFEQWQKDQNIVPLQASRSPLRAIADILANAPDFATAKKQIAVLADAERAG